MSPVFTSPSPAHMGWSGDCSCQRVRRPKGHSSEAYLNLVFSTTSQILHIVICGHCHGRSHLSLIMYALYLDASLNLNQQSTFFCFTGFNSVSLLLWEWLVRLCGFLQRGNLIKAYQEKLWKHTKESVGCCQWTKASQLTSLPNNQAFCQPDWRNTGNCAGRTCATACVVVCLLLVCLKLLRGCLAHSSSTLSQMFLLKCLKRK